MTEKICPKCGMTHPSIYVYCPKCGVKLTPRTWGKLIEKRSEKKRPFVKILVNER